MVAYAQICTGLGETGSSATIRGAGSMMSEIRNDEAAVAWEMEDLRVN